MATVNALCLAVSVFLLPYPPQVPGWLLLLVAMLSLFGAIGNRVVATIAFLLAALWGFVRYSAIGIAKMADSLEQNPFVNYDPALVITAAKVIFTLMPVVCIVFVLGIKNRQQGIAEDEERVNPIIAFIEAWKTKQFTKKFDWFNLEVCRDVKTNQPVILKGLDRYLHTLISGTTGTGKTSRIIKPWIYQDLLRIKNGHKIGITVIEPSGDLAQDVADMCRELDIPCVHVDPMNPDTDKFNIMQGNAEDVAETTRTVLKDLFGKQDAFFAQVQQTAARNTILLLKRLHGDDLDLTDVARALRDPERLGNLVQMLQRQEGETDLVQYFENELLGSMRDKYQQFAMGLRQQLEDIIGSERIRNVITGKSSIDLDKHLAEGGVLVVNSALELGVVGDTFGKFVIGQLKAAIFRRPGNEWTRIPHHLAIDEFPVYVSDDFRRLLGIGRKYRVTTSLAVQTMDDIIITGGDALAKIVLQNCRNKIVFGGMTSGDAMFWEREFGLKVEQERSDTYDNNLIVPPIIAKNYRLATREVPRIPYTKLMELKEFQFIYRIVQDSRLQEPGQGKGVLVDMKNLGKPLGQTGFDLHQVKSLVKQQAVDSLLEKAKEVGGELKQSVKELKNIKPVIERGENIITNDDIPAEKTIPIAKEPAEEKASAEKPPMRRNKIVFIPDNPAPAVTEEVTEKSAKQQKEQPTSNAIKPEDEQQKECQQRESEQRLKFVKEKESQVEVSQQQKDLQAKLTPNEKPKKQDELLQEPKAKFTNENAKPLKPEVKKGESASKEENIIKQPPRPAQPQPSIEDEIETAEFWG